MDPLRTTEMYLCKGFVEPLYCTTNVDLRGGCVVRVSAQVEHGRLLVQYQPAVIHLGESANKVQ